MYTPEITKEIVEEYTKNPTKETIEKIASRIDKSTKSVIGKLSKEGVYRKAVYTSKTGELPITKEDIVADIANLLELEKEDLVGLVKAPKQELKLLEKTIREWFGK
jgi:hypothetical protein